MGICGDDDTQEHVTEYGVHWNFYFTLAGVYLVYSFLQLFGKAAASPVAAVFIVAGTVYCAQLHLLCFFALCRHARANSMSVSLCYSDV